MVLQVSGRGSALAVRRGSGEQRGEWPSSGRDDPMSLTVNGGFTGVISVR